MNSKIRGLLAVGLLGVLAGAMCTTASAAPVSALAFDVASTNGTDANTTRGYAFNVTQSGLFATALSFWDAGGDGLTEAHNLGLWDPLGNLLASAAIASGTAAPLLDGFRYVDIAALLLPIGNGYVVGATFLVGDNDRQAMTWSNQSTAAGISYVEGRFINFTSAGVLNRPTDAFNGLPGGSLLVELRSSVPEPGSLALLGLGLAGLAGLAGLGLSRRRKAN